MATSPRSARPAALALLVRFEEFCWGTMAEFAGTAVELVAAALAEPEWFSAEGFGKTGVRTRRDQYGNNVKLQRRPRGRFELTISAYPSDDVDLNAKDTRKLQWFREHGAELDATVDAIILQGSRSGIRCR